MFSADSDELDEDDRARLHAALDAAHDEVQAGHTIDGADVIARLRRAIQGPMICTSKSVVS